ncbi:hypothetical protein HJC23_011653 [Cyclotella cryptica]|uniref:AB hydrolase-1 domain-containing protein n=1 Tax=Cyclotella cryptica TaxID=29204 RepID=A0ABD3NJ30_9STRA|eukprot:CCRYP_020823-RA/>CCRYP_020823-RA protein AED:0.37 eAED:0.37 QI:0/-1/0/1/-1/1/1/0/368
MRVIQREFEAAVGGALIHTVGKAAQNRYLKKSALKAKSAWLPSCSYEMFYLEREAKPIDGKVLDTKDQPAMIFFHGISQRSEDFSALIVSLRIPPHFRILVPEQKGHGKDIERIDSGKYTQPTHKSMLETTCEFLDVVQVGSNTSAFGISLGGGVLYYVAYVRPDIIKRSVLISPAIVPCVDKSLVRGILDGTNNFFCFESREDVKVLFRELSTGRDDTSRKKRDPVPKFFLEAIYRQSKKLAPKGHYKAMLLNLLGSVGLDERQTLSHEPENDSFNANNADPFAAVTDIDPVAKRLVIWPEKDRIINYEQGMDFFEVSLNSDGKFTSKSRTTEFESIPDCGHLFNAEGKIIIDIIRPRVREYLLCYR